MDFKLYIYDLGNLDKLQRKLSEYKFMSVGQFLHLSDSAEGINELEEEKIDNIVVDITNMIKDNAYYKIFIERYLIALYKKLYNIHFCLRSDYLDAFNEHFPYMFDEENIDLDFKEESDEHDGLIKDEEETSELNLYTYNNQTSVKRLEQSGELISLSSLIDRYEGVSFKYDIDQIAKVLLKNKVEYIDISTAIKTLNWRKDMLFMFEILIHNISKVKCIKFALESSLLSDAKELFPIIFANIVDLNCCDNQSEEISEEPKNVDIEQISLLADNISKTLKGHTDFKSDFKHNLLKFFLLNKMGERKILSILICGESGIGKTEFAKIASNAMFPKEPLIKINFGNYSTEGVLNSLIGSPLGYIGSEEGGELINKINTSKSKIILIDEFEKATPSVYNFFYELLEDGVFTDRHGVGHDLNEYIMIFTSNMSQKQYQKHIPDSLKSRFDMTYYFTELPIEEKAEYIQVTAAKLVEKLHKEFGMLIDIERMCPSLNELIKYRNMRDIKRSIEDIIFREFFKNYY